MGCVLQLHVWDRELNLPIDQDINFGSSSLGWGERVKAAKQEGVDLLWHDSESRFDSVDGVRCWWTDSVEVVALFLNFVIRNGWSSVDDRIERILDEWRKHSDQYRFVFDLV